MEQSDVDLIKLFIDFGRATLLGSMTADFIATEISEHFDPPEAETWPDGAVREHKRQALMEWVDRMKGEL